MPPKMVLRPTPTTRKPFDYTVASVISYGNNTQYVKPHLKSDIVTQVLDLTEASLPGDVVPHEEDAADINQRMAHVIRQRNMDIRALIDDFRARDVDTKMPVRNRAMIDVDTFRRAVCYAFGDKWVRIRMTTAEFERICNSYTARPHEQGRIGVQPLILWMKWAADLQQIADSPPTEIDMDAADDAELQHWLEGNHMDMGKDGVVTDKEVALAHALLRDHVGKRFGELVRAFRMVDEDKSGKLSRREMLRVLMIFNMHTTPARVFDRLMDFCDDSGDGVDFSKFAKLLHADTKDVVKKLGVERKVSGGRALLSVPRPSLHAPSCPLPPSLPHARTTPTPCPSAAGAQCANCGDRPGVELRRGAAVLAG